MRVRPGPTAWRLLFCAAWLAAGVAAAQERPRIGYVFPAGARQGATIQVMIGGRSLERVSRVHVSGGGITAEVVKDLNPMTEKEYNALRDKVTAMAKGKPDAAARKEIAQIRRKITRYQTDQITRRVYPAIGEKLTVRVVLAADAEPGEHELRLESPQGISNPLRFYVGRLPEFRQAEPELVVDAIDFRGPNYPRPVTTPITLPAVVNGQLIPREPDMLYYQPERFTPGSADRYHFEARKGQQLVIAASARQLIPYLADAVPGWFQATLTLYDAAGKELAYDDDYQFHPDPVLFFKVPADGTYTVEIKDAIYRGRPDFVYRITLGELPYITGIFPLGGRAGTPTTVKLAGWNLPTDTLTMTAKDMTPGVHRLSVQKGPMTSNALPFVVDTLPECLERESNDSQPTAQAVTLPTIVNGRIDRPGDWDVFRFAGRAGQQVVAEVNARRLESPLDSVLEVIDAAGKRLAYNDDYEDRAHGLETHHADSLLSVTLPADGDYYLRLGDAQQHGGPQYAYRLRLSAPRPDFALWVAPSCLNTLSWRLNPLTVFAQRQDGFSGAIAIRFKDAPYGLALDGSVVPEGQDQVRMTLAVAPMLAPEPVRVRLEGRAMIDGQEVVHEAMPADEMMQAFFYKHLVPARDLTIVPEDRSRYREQPARAGGNTPQRPRPPFQSQWPVLSELPVKIPAGGTALVRVRLSWAGKGEVEVDLSDPPEGLTIDKVTWEDRVLAFALRGDADKLKPGLKGNVIASAFNKATVTDKEGKTREVRNLLGLLPALPFEVVRP